MRYLVWVTVLRPLIMRDYLLRAEGKRPDEWHWADELALSWGYAVTD